MNMTKKTKWLEVMTKSPCFFLKQSCCWRWGLWSGCCEEKWVHFVSFLFKSTYNNLLHSSSFCDSPKGVPGWFMTATGRWNWMRGSWNINQNLRATQQKSKSWFIYPPWNWQLAPWNLDDWKIRSPFGMETIFRCDDRCELLVSSSVSRSYFKQQAKTSAPYPPVVSIEARAKSAALHEWVSKVKTLKGSIFQKNLRKVREYPFRNIRYIIFSCCNLK